MESSSVQKLTRGVTLLELLIVVVIIGIIAAFAYPNYRDYVQRSKRSEAMSALLQIATEQERFYLNSNTYTSDLTDLGFPADDFTTGSGSYVVEVTAADTNTWSATATYQNDDEEAGKCLTFNLNATGEKTSTPRADCWTNTR
jgi:type IV pilus assembly protein PilE